ncbi:MAG: hypothetical protein PHE15_00090 [Dehalococcoidales bacterium]|nr:hypothetical protein [Dehalococcoidales bacterium]
MKYPTEEQLKYIKEFDITKHRVFELLDFIEQIWEFGDWGFHRTKHTLELDTGGWSGNEDIIDALQLNYLFWSLYWEEHRRGGHYKFNDEMVSDELKGFEGEQNG